MADVGFVPRAGVHIRVDGAQCGKPVLGQLYQHLLIVQPDVIAVEPILHEQLPLLGGIGGFPHQLIPLRGSLVQAAGAVADQIGQLAEHRIVFNADPLVIGRSLQQVFIPGQAHERVQVIGHDQLFHDGLGNQAAIQRILFAIPFAPYPHEADREKLHRVAPFPENRLQLPDMPQDDVLRRIVDRVIAGLGVEEAGLHPQP